MGSDKQRGQLVEKYYTLSKKFVKAGIIEKTLKRKLTHTPDKPPKQLITEIENFEDQNNNFLWLQKNFNPEVLVVEKWQNSFELRKHHIKDATIDILTEWPIIKQKIGISLVSLSLVKGERSYINM